MRSNRTHYVLLGGFVLLALGTLLTALYMLGGSRGPTYAYYTALRNVAGVNFGTPVTYAGYTVGQVESVAPEQTDAGTRYLLELAVRDDWRIPDDSLARVVADGLLSAVSIDIEEGASRRYLQPQGHLQGQSASNVFASMTAVAGEFENLSRDALRPLLGRLRGSVDVLSEALEATAPTLLRNLSTVSEHMDEQLPRIFADLQVASAALRTGTPQLAATVQRGAQRVDDVLSDANLAHVDNILANLDSASAGIVPLVARLRTTANSMHKAIAAVDALIQTSSPEIAAALADIRNTLLGFGDTVDTLSHHLEGSSRNMHEFSRRIRDNPSTLLLGTAPQEVSRP